METRQRRRRLGSSVASRAVALWSARSYDQVLDSLMDMSGNGLHARLGSTVGPDTNDPLRLQYRGRKDVYVPGSIGNGLTAQQRTISTVPVSERIEVSSASLADTGPLYLIGNRSTHQQLYKDTVGNGGVATFMRYDITAGTFRTARSSVAIPSNAMAIASEWNGLTTVNFYYATMEDLASASWQALGVPQTITAVATVQVDWQAVVGCVTHALSGSVLTGRVTQARWFRNGTLFERFDASLLTEPYSGYTDATTGTVWTLNRSASGRKLAVVDRDMFLLGTDDYFEVADHPLLNFGASEDFTAVLAIRIYGTPAAAFGRYLSKRPSGGAGYEILNLSNANRIYYFHLSDGTTTKSTSAMTPNMLQGTAKLIGGGRRDGANLFVISNGTIFSGTSSGTTKSTSVLRIGTIAASGAYQDMEFFGAAIFREALSADDLRRLACEFDAFSAP